MRTGDVVAGSMDPALAGLVWDLHMAGVGYEVGEAPRVWWDELRAEHVNDVLEAPVVARAPVAVLRERPMAVEPVVAAEPEVWGESGGLVVVAGGRLADVALDLFQRMMMAVGAHVLPRGWVVVPNGALAADVRAKVQGLAPARVLILGKAPLALLAGQDVGVDAWHHAPVPFGFGVPAGVTYGVEFLLEQPAFKRRAWQHLLVWQRGF